MTSSVRTTLYVQPRAAKTAIAGMHDGLVKIRLAAPPVEGEANRALTEFIAGKLGIPKSRVRVVAGAASRRKIVEMDGVTALDVAAALGA